MKLLILNASPKRRGGASQFFSGILRLFLPGLVKKTVPLRSRKDFDHALSQLGSADAVCISFPLYVDGLPSHLAEFLSLAEEYCKARSLRFRLYAIANNGFIEGQQNRTALRILESWCLHSGAIWSGGVGIGGGVMLRVMGIVYPVLIALGRNKEMIDKWIAEATECDFKVALEVRKPKSWLKSVSAFANGIGGTLFFGIDDNRNVVGLADAQADAEAISRLIKERITPYPNFILTPEREKGRDILILSISAGRSTPYYYKADGVMEAYIRMGNESVMAPSYVLNQLLLKGMNHTFDALISEYNFKDYAFSKLRERYKAWTGNSMEEKLFDSFEIRNEYGKLTNAGALLADDAPIKQSRLFCTRWNGLDKSGGMVDALDGAEYSGSLIILLNEGVSFVKRNMKTRWKKTANSRIEMPDYCERSVFEALVNALIHRDYLILGSEVHIDIYDDRLTITSPGGMADGTRIQERDIFNISSTRRNPVLADIFGRLGYMERQGSGFRKITEAYHAAHNYRDELEPKFYSDASSFQVTLYNLNYGTAINTAKVMIEDENVAITPDYLAIEVAIDGLSASQATIKKAKTVFASMGIDGIFGRSDIAAITSDSVTAAGNLITKLKKADLIEAVSGFGKGKYKFRVPKV